MHEQEELEKGACEKSCKEELASAEEEKRPQNWKKLIGMSFAIISALLHATTTFCVKKLRVNPTDILIVRAPIQIIGVGIFSLVKSGTFLPLPKTDSSSKRRWMQPLALVFCTLCVAWSYLGGFICVRLLPIGDAVTLIFMNPVFTAVVAIIFRGVKIRALRIFFIILIVVGVILIVQPPFIFGESTLGEHHIVHDLWYYTGVLVALSVALSISIIYNLLGGPLRNVSASILFHHVGFSCFAIALVSSQFDEESRIFTHFIAEITVMEWVTILGIVLAGMLALYLNLRASQMVDTMVVAMLKCLEIPVSYLVQIYVMQKMPSAFGGTGACLVVLSVVIIPCEKVILRAIPDKFKLKKYF